MVSYMSIKMMRVTEAAKEQEKTHLIGIKMLLKQMVEIYKGR